MMPCRRPTNAYFSSRSRILAGAVGVLASGAAAAPALGQSFCFVALPDTQEYVREENQLVNGSSFDGAGTFNRQTQWIVDHRAAYNLEFVTHLGDLWNDYSYRPAEHVLGNEAMSRLDGHLPYAVTIGNHDYDQVGTVNGFRGQVFGTQTFESYFGPESSHFKDKPWYGGSFRGVNSYQTFAAGGRDFLHLSLEMEFDDDVIGWAQGVLDAHPGVPAFMTTHEWLFPFDEPGSSQAQWQDVRYRKAFPANSAKEAFDELVKINSQIFMVLAGHAFRGDDGESMRIDLNDAGLPVYSMLSNYQGRDKGGNGLLRLLEFTPGRDELHVSTFSTETLQYERDADSEFTLPLDLNAYAAAAAGGVVPEPAGLLAAGAAATGLLLRRR